jgi:ankyrin repeat protein
LALFGLQFAVCGFGFGFKNRVASRKYSSSKRSHIAHAHAQLLTAAAADPNQVNKEKGDTPLHIAAERSATGNPIPKPKTPKPQTPNPLTFSGNSVVSLLAARADPLIINNDGLVPLHLACK